MVHFWGSFRVFQNETILVIFNLCSRPFSDFYDYFRAHKLHHPRPWEWIIASERVQDSLLVNGKPQEKKSRRKIYRLKGEETLGLQIVILLDCSLGSMVTILWRILPIPTLLLSSRHADVLFYSGLLRINIFKSGPSFYLLCHLHNGQKSYISFSHLSICSTFYRNFSFCINFAKNQPVKIGPEEIEKL